MVDALDRLQLLQSPLPSSLQTFDHCIKSGWRSSKVDPVSKFQQTGHLRTWNLSSTMFNTCRFSNILACMVTAWYHDWGFSPCQRPLVWTERWQIPRRFSWRAVQPCRGMARWRWNCGWRRRSCGSRPGLPGLEDPQRCDFEAIFSHFEPTSCGGTSPTAVVYVHYISRT